MVGAHAFRLTRSGDLQLDESSTANFLQAIEEELARRQQRPVVRIEIESATPEPLHGLLQRAIRFEESDQESTLDPSDVYVAAGPLQLGDLRDASLPRAASLVRPAAAGGRPARRARRPRAPPVRFLHVELRAVHRRSRG